MKKKRLAFLLLAGLSAASAVLALRGATARPGMARPAGTGWPANLAHRGASARAPENTLEAFRLAAEAGAGGLELDVRVTADGRVVVLHDATVGRTTDGGGAVSGMTLADVRALDAGHRFEADGVYPYRGRGVRVPTLAGVYEAFPGLAVNVDVKDDLPGVEDLVLGVVRAAGAGGRTLVVSQHHGVVGRLRRVSGGRVFTGASRREIFAFYLLCKLKLERLAVPAYDALQVPVRHRGLEVVSRRFVRAAHAAGVRVDAWTVDDPGEMRRLLDLGVDVVMTNRPEELARVLASRRTGGPG